MVSIDNQLSDGLATWFYLEVDCVLQETLDACVKARQGVCKLLDKPLLHGWVQWLHVQTKSQEICIQHIYLRLG